MSRKNNNRCRRDQDHEGEENLDGHADGPADQRADADFEMNFGALLVMHLAGDGAQESADE